MKDFLEKERLINREFYEFYKTNRKSVAKEIDQYNYFVKAIGGILQLIKKEAYEREFGVYIENFGHFCFIRGKNPKRNPLEKSPLKKSKKIFIWQHWFIPENDKLKDWYYRTESHINKPRKHTIDLDATRLFLEVNRYNERLRQESKNIKYII